MRRIEKSGSAVLWGEQTSLREEHTIFSICCQLDVNHNPSGWLGG